MKDFLGKTLEVGQEVIVCHRESKHTANLMKSRVVGFTEHMVRIAYKSWRGDTTKLTEPRKLVALPAGDTYAAPSA